MAAHFKVPERHARHVLNRQILPALRVVDLEIRVAEVAGLAETAAVCPNQSVTYEPAA